MKLREVVKSRMRGKLICSHFTFLVRKLAALSGGIMLCTISSAQRNALEIAVNKSNFFLIYEHPFNTQMKRRLSLRLESILIINWNFTKLW